MQTFSLAKASADMAALYKTGLFEDVDLLPRPSGEAAEDNPSVRPPLLPFWRFQQPASALQLLA